MNARCISRYLLAAAFIVAGANHFLNPAIYLSMMPPKEMERVPHELSLFF